MHSEQADKFLSTVLSAECRSEERLWQRPVHKHPAKAAQGLPARIERGIRAYPEAAGALPGGGRGLDEHRHHTPLKSMALDTRSGACTRYTSLGAARGVGRVERDRGRAEGTDLPGYRGVFSGGEPVHTKRSYQHKSPSMGSAKEDPNRAAPKRSVHIRKQDEETTANKIDEK